LRWNGVSEKWLNQLRKRTMIPNQISCELRRR
jgi:hypothetical protein